MRTLVRSSDWSDTVRRRRSDDNGRTWDEGHQLRYEEGPLFDPVNWGDSQYFRSNEMYIGGAAALANGTVAISATVPVEHRDEEESMFIRG